MRSFGVLRHKAAGMGQGGVTRRLGAQALYAVWESAVRYAGGTRRGVRVDKVKAATESDVLTTVWR